MKVWKEREFYEKQGEKVGKERKSNGKKGKIAEGRERECR